MIPTTYFICDESGDISTNLQKERTKGELAVVAGFFVSSLNRRKLNVDLEQCMPKDTHGKVHMREIEGAEAKETLRNEVFKVLKAHQVKWTYQAIYVQGFYEASLALQEAQKALKSSEEERTGLKIHLRFEKESILDELYPNFFAEALDILNLDGKDENVIMLTDRIERDEELLEGNREFLDPLRPRTTISSVWNPVEKASRKFSTTLTVSDPSGYLASYEKINSRLVIDKNNTPLTIASDVLANSTVYYLKGDENPILRRRLNSKEAISNHPLSDLCIVRYDNWLDDIYAHPEAT
jgi:hypothetical protein